MDNLQKDRVDNTSNREDIDLGVLLYKIGKAISNMFGFLKRCILALINAIVFFFFFLRRNFLWLLIGSSAGLIFGIYQNITNGSKYAAHMTVRTNFGSARALYNTVDYLNALINADNSKELAAIFGINLNEASSLSQFSVEPVKEELVVAEMYKDNFFQYDRNEAYRTDTFWNRTLKYENFKDIISKYDYPLHEITSVSNNQQIFQKIQNGILNLISNNDVLQRNKLIEEKTLLDEEALLNSSLNSLDTLRKSYNQALLLKGNSERTGPMFNFLDKSTVIESPELEVYEKVLMINGQLKQLRKRVAERKDIIQVYSPFNKFGSKQGLIRQSFVKNTISGFIITLVLLIILSLNKYMGLVESRKKVAR